MSTLSLRLSESLHRHAKALEKREGISINQLVATALAEKISALNAGEYLEMRAQRGDRKKFERALSKVIDVPPDECDRHSREIERKTIAALGMAQFYFRIWPLANTDRPSSKCRGYS